MRTTRPAALDSTIYSENAPKGGWESSNARGAPESARTLLQGAAKSATTTGMSESYSTHTQLECVSRSMLSMLNASEQACTCIHCIL